MAVSGTNIYVGGDFTTAGGNTANRIAVYNTSNNTWSALGTGLSSSVNTIAISGTNIYVGGAFGTAGGISATAIAVYNTSNSSWSALGSGLSAVVRTIAVLGTNIYVGGDFTTAGGNTANRIAVCTYDYINLQFNSQTISTLYTNRTGSQVNSYLINGTTYVTYINNLPILQ
jgi:hypothetical protein